jgi:hypothetical protein
MRQRPEKEFSILTEASYEMSILTDAWEEGLNTDQGLNRTF